MLKREITYEDFNGDTVTEVFYFNLTKTELLELEVEQEGGLSATLQSIVETKDNRHIINEFKKIILMAYGEKTPDGKRFIKSDELREAFSQTAAYSALFMELATNENAAANFINGIVPPDLAAAVAEERLKQQTAEQLTTPPQTKTAEIAAQLSNEQPNPQA